MATANSAGVDYTVPPNRPASGAVNNHGSATRVGTSSNFDNVSVSRTQGDMYGSVVNDDDYADKAVSAGTFRYNNQRPIAIRLTSSLSGVENTVLLTGADVPEQLRSINKRESFKVVKTATGIRENKYNRYSNTWANGYPQTGTENPGNDVAATPTRSAPGDLVFRTGAKLPVTTQDYKPKTG